MDAQIPEHRVSARSSVGGTQSTGSCARRDKSVLPVPKKTLGSREEIEAVFV